MNYNRLILLFLMLISVPALFSAPVTKLPLSVTQPDGSSLTIYASGDEFHNWLHDANNYTIVKDDNGWYVYAQRSGNRLIAGDERVGSANPALRGLEPGLNISPAERKAKYDRYRDTMLNYSNGRSPHTGQFNNLVVFIRFADDPAFSQPIGTYETMFNSSQTGANSMRNYFYDASYQQLEVDSFFYPAPNGTTVTCYVDPQPRNYYRPLTGGNTIGYDPNDDNERTIREQTMLANCITAIGPGIPDTIDFDGDDDGYIDNVCFIVQGSPDGWAELLWPHRWNLFAVDAYLHGALVWDFNLQLETFLASEGASVLSHEMFHSLGAPDLYRYEDNTITPIGGWDLMASNSNPPQHMSAWMKYRYGQWLPAPTLTTVSGEYTLSPVSMSSTNNILRLPSWRNNETYVLEYRKNGGVYDNNLPGYGLLIYRLDNREQGNAGGPPDELYIYRPGGTDTTTNGILSQAAFSANNNRREISEATSPNGFLGNNTSGGLNVYDIGQMGDTITFKVKISDVQLTFPHGGETWFSGTSKTITWKAKSGSGSVKLEYSTDDGATWNLITPSTLNVGSYNWTNVAAIDSDNCRIRVTHLTSGQSDYNVYPFTVISQLGIPEPTYPAANATGVPTNPTLNWLAVPGATSYNVQVSADPAFSYYEINLLDHPQTSYAMSGLSPFTTYYWRVCANSEIGEGIYFEALAFTTGQISEYPAVPTLVSPTNNSVNQPLNLTLRWNASYLADSYHVQISTNQYFSQIVQEAMDLSLGTYECQPLQPSTVYYWRVRAHNVMGYSNFTSNRKFTTGTTVDNDDVTAAPYQNALMQNSPNPFNPSTAISYELADLRAPVSLTIYNQRGQAVRTLISGNVFSNRGNVIWDGKDDSGKPAGSGIYLYRLRQGDYIATRKMLLIK